VLTKELLLHWSLSISVGSFGPLRTLIAFIKVLYRRQIEWDKGFFAEELHLAVMIKSKLVLNHLDDFVEVLLHLMFLQLILKCWNTYLCVIILFDYALFHVYCKVDVRWRGLGYIELSLIVKYASFCKSTLWYYSIVNVSNEIYKISMNTN